MEGLSQSISDMILGLYGPKFCAHCQKIQPVNTFVLAKSEWTESETDGEKRIMRSGFIGSYQCRVCMRTIEPQAQTQQE